MVDEEKEDVKQRIASAAGVNEKTVERQSKNLISTLAGVSAKDLEEDPYLRAYVRYLWFDEDPAPWIILDEEARAALEERKKARQGLA